MFTHTREGLTFTLSHTAPEELIAVQNWCREQGIKSIFLGDHADMKLNAQGAPVLVPVPGYTLTVTCATEEQAEALLAHDALGS